MFAQRTKADFEKLYAENARLVRNVIFNMTGEGPLDDLTQEAFLKIWKGLPTFSFRSSLKTWAYKIAINVAVDYLRKKGPFTCAVSENDLLQDGPVDLDSRRNSVHIQNALFTLDEAHRAVIVLFYFEDLKLSEIASVLDVPEGTVKSRLFTAKQLVQKYLAEKGVSL